MSFWNTSAGTQAQAKSSIEVGGGNLPPIPNNTKVKAFITESKWEDSSERDEQEGKGQQHIKLRWDVIEGPYKKRVVFQKIFAEHTDAEKRDKALEMLMVIDFNAGGSLSKAAERPSDMSLTKGICNKPMIIQTQVWQIKDNSGNIEKEGNWINGVYSSTEVKATEAAKPTTPAQETFDDDIDF